MATNQLKDIKDSALGKSSSYFSGNNLSQGNLPIDGQSKAPSIQVGSVPAPQQSTTQKPIVPATQPINAPKTVPAQTGGVDVASIQARLAEITANALKVKASADELAAKEKSSTTNLYRDTSNIVGEEKKTVQDVKNLTASNLPTAPATGTTAAQTESDKYLAQLDAERTMLEERRKNEIAAIEAQFAQTKQQTETAQTKETGTMTSQLARIGGYLGDSASATGALINLATTHRNEISSLESKKASAIQAANNAIDDKQFALARLKAQEAKDVEKEIYDRRNKFFEQSMALSQEERAQDKAERERAKEDLENLALLDPEQISPEEYARLDAVYGIDGFSESYVQVVSAQNAAKSDKDRADARKSQLEFLQNIPAGQTITFPGDPNTYTGIGKASDVSTFMQTNDAGYSTIITFNKLTGERSVVPVGMTGKSKGGGLLSGAEWETTKNNAIATVQMVLQQKLREAGAGATYDVDEYLQLRAAAGRKDPRLISYIDNVFVPNLETAQNKFNQDGIQKLTDAGVPFKEIDVAEYNPIIVDTDDTQSE